MIDSPDVSVVLAVRNEAIYIREALSSICSQGGLSFEVIVVDDESTDGTHALASEFAGPALRVLRNPGRGKVSAFNLGVAESRGDFICLFAGDDIMPPGSLAARWHAVRDRGAAAVGLCKIQTMCDDARHDGLIIPRRQGRGALSGASPLMGREATARLFPVPESLPNEDTWMELAVTYLPRLNVVHSDMIGCRWRIHEHNSMNLRFDFGTFNSRYTQRMAALSLFRDQHCEELSSEALQELDGLIECEIARAEGSAIGVLRSRAALVPKFRALAYTNAAMYGIRSRLYGLLSGW